MKEPRSHTHTYTRGLRLFWQSEFALVLSMINGDASRKRHLNESPVTSLSIMDIYYSNLRSRNEIGRQIIVNGRSPWIQKSKRIEAGGEEENHSIRILWFELITRVFFFAVDLSPTNGRIFGTTSTVILPCSWSHRIRKTSRLRCKFNYIVARHVHLGWATRGMFKVKRSCTCLSWKVSLNGAEWLNSTSLPTAPEQWALHS